MNKNKLHTSACALSLLALTAIPVEAALVFDFEDGLQGWTNVRTSTIDNVTASYTTGDPGGVGNKPDPFEGDSFAFPTPFGPTATSDERDSAHETLVLRSPTFFLSGDGDITAKLTGGTGSAASPASSFDLLPPGTSTGGFLGLALRDAATGAYVLSVTKFNTGDGINGAGYETVTLSAVQLAGLDQDAQYTLDLIDTHHGNWGWVAMDDVSISGTAVPEPAMYSLLLGLGVLALGCTRRRRAPRAK